MEQITDYKIAGEVEDIVLKFLPHICMLFFKKTKGIVFHTLCHLCSGRILIILENKSIAIG
jgi:uncharacterized protein YrrD